MTAPRFKGDPPTHFASPLLEDAGVPHLFTTRHFPGVTAFRDPHPPLGDPAWPLLDAHGLARSPAAFLKQVHGATVIQARAGGLAGEPACTRLDDRRPVHLLEKSRRAPSQTVRVEQRPRGITERRMRIAEGRDAGEVARGEEMRHAGVLEERRGEVRGRIALEARRGHASTIVSRDTMRSCATRRSAPATRAEAGTVRGATTSCTGCRPIADWSATMPSTSPSARPRRAASRS